MGNISNHEGEFILEQNIDGGWIPQLAYSFESRDASPLNGADALVYAKGRFERAKQGVTDITDYVIFAITKEQGAIPKDAGYGIRLEWDRLPSNILPGDTVYVTIIKGYQLQKTPVIDNENGTGTEINLAETNNKYYYIAAATRSHPNPHKKGADIHWNNLRLTFNPDELSPADYTKLDMYQTMLHEEYKINPTHRKVKKIAERSLGETYFVSGTTTNNNGQQLFGCFPSGMYMFGRPGNTKQIGEFGELVAQPSVSPSDNPAPALPTLTQLKDKELEKAAIAYKQGFDAAIEFVQANPNVISSSTSSTLT